MATTTRIVLVDDLDGGPADRTVTIALDGESFELDLSTSHRNELIRSLARYMAAGRRLDGGGAPTVRFTETAADPRAVRAWARAHGIDVPDGRRVPASVIEQFRAAGN